jgi:hypothetical protein
MDTNSFMELELTIRYLQEVNRHRDSILRMNILRQDDNGLARIIVNEADIPCPPPRPKPRIFQCPGIKQVTWIQTPQPHYLIIGHPTALILVTKQRILRKAYKNLGYILEQMDAKAALQNWRHQRPPLIPWRSISVSPEPPQAVTISRQHTYVDPISSRQPQPQPPRPSTSLSGRHSVQSSPSTSSYNSSSHLSFNMPLQTSQSRTNTNNEDEMPVLMRNEDTSLSDFLGWLPKY